MAQYTVTRVRKEWSSDGTHQHIEGVCTQSGQHYTRADVAASINAGNTWRSSGGGAGAPIEVIPFCPHARCVATPYLRTRPDSSRDDNLDNLPAC